MNHLEDVTISLHTRLRQRARIFNQQDSVQSRSSDNVVFSNGDIMLGESILPVYFGNIDQELCVAMTWKSQCLYTSGWLPFKMVMHWPVESNVRQQPSYSGISYHPFCVHLQVTDDSILRYGLQVCK